MTMKIEQSGFSICDNVDNILNQEKQDYSSYLNYSTARERKTERQRAPCRLNTSNIVRRRRCYILMSQTKRFIVRMFLTLLFLTLLLSQMNSHP